MNGTGGGLTRAGGHGLVAVLRDDPAVWWSWTETARRVWRLYDELRATLKDLSTPRERAIEDLADRLSWSFGGLGHCEIREDWRDAAEELLGAL